MGGLNKNSLLWEFSNQKNGLKRNSSIEKESSLL